jgi:hypothetical protein
LQTRRSGCRQNRRLQSLRAIGSGRQKEIDALAGAVSDYQKAIDNHTLFGANGRFADRRKEARKGDRARLLKNEEIVQRAGLNVAYYTTIWRMLSSHVHAHPDAISSLETFSASDPDSAISLGLIVRFAVAYGSWAALEFEKHFPACSIGFEGEDHERAELNAAMLRVDLASI